MTILNTAKRITTRKLKGRTRRAMTLSTKITSREELIAAASEADGRALGEWIRGATLKAAHSSSSGFGADHLMTEIVALQLFLTDVLSPVACGERMSTGQYEKLMRNVKTNKQRAAPEVIAQYLAEKRGEAPCLKQTGEEKRPSSMPEVFPCQTVQTTQEQRKKWLLAEALGQVGQQFPGFHFQADASLQIASSDALCPPRSRTPTLFRCGSPFWFPLGNTALRRCSKPDTQCGR